MFLHRRLSYTHFGRHFFFYISVDRTQLLPYLSRIMSCGVDMLFSWPPSSDSFRESLVSKPEPGPNYARLMEEYYSAKSAHIPTKFEGENGLSGSKSKLFEGRRDGPDDESQSVGDNASSTMDGEPVTNDENHLEGGDVKETDDMIKSAHDFYKMSMPLLTDGFLSLKDRSKNRAFFLDKQRPCEQAFRIIQIELNLIYDIFYTKLFLFQRNRAYARVLCLFLALASLLTFFFQDGGKYSDHHVDVIVTFTLLGGAIALDLLTAVMFVLSGWWVILCFDGMSKTYLQSLMQMILRWSKWARQHNRTRWSNSISKYNLLRRFRKPSSLFNLIYLFKIKEIRDVLVGILYVKEDQIEEDLIKYLIEGLKSKAIEAEEMAVAKKVCSARGNLILQKDYFLASECLSPWTVDVDYDESLLIWHLATDICYWTTSDDKDDAGSSESKDRRFSKALADYMAYVILRQQKMVSALVGMSETRFEHTCAEANKFMNNNCINVSWLEDCWWKAKRFRFASSQDKKSPSEKAEAEFFKKFSEKVLQVKADVQPLKAKGDKSKSILFDACRLAKQLELFGEKQWEITAKVWVELLCYAAIRCSPRSHIARLSKGGELLTLVWLFMTHLGLGERFLQNQGFGWTKLIIHK
ncbi:uncharacterized protein LOC110689269 isoform X1 [Chenopodium quinoa]|uniref:uncharacterized protein LOC110689269 isoform X1 n=1 Tax=Chenopodium quinoa TaxID=63459 RepID=UPI000B77D766|nr:uncharacterized protein LOC110689269 isoform X1 [Chenopodium quinoa]